MKRFVYINDDSRRHSYCDNRISNTKYTLWNFLPKNLWEQFRRFMNQYFLLIACLQLWSRITPVSPATTWGPLIIIFIVSASKEAWDDYNRYLSDKKANERKVWLVKDGIRKQIKAQEIHVGDIVWLHENDEIPCDLVLIGTSDPQGICYVETSALDGETDLKTRIVPSISANLSVKQLEKVKGVIECPNPDNDIRRFDANMRLFLPTIDNEKCPLTINNTLLQSCYLRYTEWACGVAVYTGNETKSGMTRGTAEPKLTAADVMIDKLTIAIFLLQIVVVLVLGYFGNIWKDTQGLKQWYLMYHVKGPWYDFLVIPLRFELLCSIMIPISIKVTLDLSKGVYAKFIDWDEQMFDWETNTPAHSANTAISEDLGQVEYILTDKTGTLTENRMIFKQCCISNTMYGSDNGDALKDARLLNAVSSNDPDVIKFLMVMALCNTVVPVKSNDGTVSYKAQSQDEEALVTAASNLNMMLISKDSSTAEICFNGSKFLYELLDILEFTSDRKRMSVVVKDGQTGKIHLLSKGADEAILPRAYPGQQIQRYLEAVEMYSQLGLRTLCLGWRDLEEDEYKEWSKNFQEASCSLDNRESKIAKVCHGLERDLYILGVTAIEDRLQDGVPETIKLLRNAGINVWMLTGDKQNTAIQIGLLCNLITSEPNSQLLPISGKTEEDILRSLDRALLITKNTCETKDLAFVLDGRALEIILKHSKESFTRLAMLSRTAICCRMTPLQKAQLVAILKSVGYLTLAIGDGGNDVRMIQEANIGVGISGREGLQAARAADYSIGKFKFLKRLILIHGRYSYNRTAFISQYSFYKSLLICFIQILFAFFSGLSGTSLFNSISLMAYNVFYTSLPVMTIIFDKDISETTILQYPQILQHSQAGRLLNRTTFCGWFGRSLYHALVVFFITVYAYADEKSEMQELSMVALSGCIWLQAFVVTMDTNSFTYPQIILIWGNFVAFYMINLILSAIPSLHMYTIMFRLCGQPSYWITMALTVAVGMGPVMAFRYFRNLYRPSAINILQQIEQSNGSIQPSRNVESAALKSARTNLTNLLSGSRRKRSSDYQPLLSDPAEPAG
ncbi:phospholipid-transporting ATPase 2-like isoform X3 [Panicum virgatum]|uniref:phospholipid-transporting ATPase 2-like isoform X3 n=1 Tax=Panicum virgatum TaxID=38727 RepID=UPI0019D5204D|nr:phospholipid-transporting ATPase 2-like isoform X3 [Panicum virgatum]